MDIQKNWRRILYLLLIVVMVYWTANNLKLLQSGLNILSSALMPFLIGAGLAFILNLPMNFIENTYKKYRSKVNKPQILRLVSILISYTLLILLFLILIFLVIPDLQQTISSFIETVPEKVTDLVNFISDLINSNPEIVSFVQELDIDLGEFQTRAIQYIQTFAADLVSRSFSLITATVSSVITTFVALVFSFYLLSMKEKLIRQGKKLIYSFFTLPWANYFVNVGKKANEIFTNFVGGQIVEAFILGILVYVGMWLFSFPYRLSISVITGVLALIPIYGAFLGGLSGFILIAVVDFTQALWFIVFIIILQQIEGNIIYPRVVGSSVGLPGIWVMFTVTIGGSLFGLIGMLIGVPVVSLIYALVSAQVNYRLAQKGLDIHTDSHNI